MTPDQTKALARALDDIDLAVRALRITGPALLARDAVTTEPDSLPGGGTTERHGKGDHADPAFQAATSKTLHDPIHRLAVDLVALAKDAAKSIVDAAAIPARAVLLSSADNRHSNGPVDCRACGRQVQCTTADPVRAGYCTACSTAWYRWKTDETAAGRTPDRVAFEKQRAAHLTAGYHCGHGCCHIPSNPHHTHLRDPAECHDCLDAIAS